MGKKARPRPSNRIWRARFGAAAAHSPAFQIFSPVRLAWDRLRVARWLEEVGLKFERQARAAWLAEERGHVRGSRLVAVGFGLFFSAFLVCTRG